MTVRSRSLVAVGFVLAALIAAPALAQTPTTSTSSSGHSITLSGNFGYLFAKTTGDGGDKVPAGWVAGIEGVFDGRYAAVVEFAGSYQSAHTYRTILGGGRFILPKAGSVTPFVQLLAGKGRSSAVGDENSAFTLQPGGGVDWFMSPHVGVRLQADYDWRHRPEANTNGYRFAASVIIR